MISARLRTARALAAAVWTHKQVRDCFFPLPCPTYLLQNPQAICELVFLLTRPAFKDLQRQGVGRAPYCGYEGDPPLPHEHAHIPEARGIAVRARTRRWARCVSPHIVVVEISELVFQGILVVEGDEHKQQVGDHIAYHNEDVTRHYNFSAQDHGKYSPHVSVRCK